MLKPKFTNSQIREILEKRRDRILRAAQLRLQRIGEAFVTNARNNGAYKDHTGNLRSSIGYVILSNGIQVDANFKASPAASSEQGKELIKLVGVEKAQEVIQKIADSFSNGHSLMLIVVAGMEYAAAVESKGFDVLTASSLIAKNDLQKSFEELQNKVNKI